MAEDQDQSQKTEEPTQRRLEEARRKGQVAASREVNHVFILGAGTLLIGGMGAHLVVRLGDLLLPFVAAPHALPTDPDGLGRLARRARSRRRCHAAPDHDPARGRGDRGRTGAERVGGERRVADPEARAHLAGRGREAAGLAPAGGGVPEGDPQESAW